MDDGRTAPDPRERMAAAFEQRQRRRAAPVAAVTVPPAPGTPADLADRIARLERELADRERALAEREWRLEAHLARLAMAAE